MSNHIDATIEEIKIKIETKLKEISGLKAAINELCKMNGKPEMFTDTSSEKIGTSMVIQNDQFHNKPLATAVKEYLTMRGTSAKAEEILEALKRGGYDFSGSTKDDIQLRNLKISFGKNPAFTYIRSNETYGLAEKYGIDNKKKGKEIDVEILTREEQQEIVDEEESKKKEMK